MKVATRLKSLRMARGLTQRELAEPRYSHAYVSQIEAGRRQPSADACEHFAAKLGVSIEELVTGRPPDLEARLRLQLQEARRQVFSGKLTEAESAYLDAEKEARRFGLERVRADAQFGLALCAERQGRLADAAALYLETETLLLDSSPTARVPALVGRAFCLQRSGELRYAIHILEDTLETLERARLTDPDSLVRLHAALVAAYFEAGLYKKANVSASEALRLAPAVSDAATLANMHVNVARVLLDQGKPDDALSSLQKAEHLFDELDLSLEMGRAHLAQAFIHSRTGDLAAAREALQRCLPLFVSSNDASLETQARAEIGRIERLEGNLEAARGELERAIELAGDEALDTLGWVRRELALCLKDHDPQAAEVNLRLAIAIFERSDQPTELAATHRELGDLLQQVGKREEASNAYRSGILILEQKL